MKIVVKMTKDETNHRSFLVFIPMSAVKKTEKILEQMEKKTGVPWKVNMEKSNGDKLAVETGDLSKWFRINKPVPEEAYAYWRRDMMGQNIEILTGK